MLMLLVPESYFDHLVRCPAFDGGGLASRAIHGGPDRTATGGQGAGGEISHCTCGSSDLDGGRAQSTEGRACVDVAGHGGVGRRRSFLWYLGGPVVVVALDDGGAKARCTSHPEQSIEAMGMSLQTRLNHQSQHASMLCSTSLPSYVPLRPFQSFSHQSVPVLFPLLPLAQLLVSLGLPPCFCTVLCWRGHGGEVVHDCRG